MLSIIFVVKTKITIWAESICGFSPFFFSFQKFYRTMIKKNDNIDNKRQRFFNSFPKNVVQGCPKLLSEIARQQRQQKTTILFIPIPKMLSKVVVRKSHSIRPYFSSSPLRSYCFLFPTGGSVRVIRTTAVRERLRCTASSKASIC